MLDRWLRRGPGEVARPALGGRLVSGARGPSPRPVPLLRFEDDLAVGVAEFELGVGLADLREPFRQRGSRHDQDRHHPGQHLDEPVSALQGQPDE